MEPDIPIHLLQVVAGHATVGRTTAAHGPATAGAMETIPGFAKVGMQVTKAGPEKAGPTDANDG